MNTTLADIHNRGGAEILKASAGSGKTFSLAREYIRLLLSPRSDGVRDERAYRHILAVTFTNKATGEMKSRIIDELHILARTPSESSFTSYLMEHCGFSNLDELQSWAGKAIRAILNDFGAFSISTIDRFFQSTLRSFSREIGQFGEYQIELDRKSLVNEATARMLDSISESDRGLLKWISDYSIREIEEGNGYRFENMLSEFASGYMSGSYSDKLRKEAIDEDKAFSEENIKRLEKLCRDIMMSFKKELDDAVQDAKNLISGHPHPNKNLVNALDKLSGLEWNGKIEISGATLPNVAQDGHAGFLKGKSSDAEAEALQKAIGRIMKLAEAPLRVRNTAAMLTGQSYIFRIADSLKREFQALLKEKNVLCLEDTNEILKGIIGGTETPFIYEKTGIRYQHFLLDEFQDTSRVQWDNFIQLLRNSISEGCYNLIVGDVKQSIYRWRDSDWKILDEEVEEELQTVFEHPLEHNWRSAHRIVEFNNAFYRTLASRLDTQLHRTLPDGSPDRRLERIYADVEQKATEAIGKEGCVDATLCDNKRIIPNTVAAVREAIAHGFDLKDIAVLVRKNKEGMEVACALMDEGIDVVTNDSLMIDGSVAVQKLVAQLYLFNDPSDSIHSYGAKDLDKEGLDNARSLTDLAEEILRQLKPEGDDLFILAFMDILQEFTQRNGNSLDAFLKHWEEVKGKRSVSSPEGCNAVTIITIHKAKGLDFPCVILPCLGKNDFMRSTDLYWEAPAISGTRFEEVHNALYHVPLSEKSMNTLFRDNYLHEQQLACIDSVNTWYVATTRASQYMHVIIQDRGKDDWDKIGSIPSAMQMFVTQKDSLFEKAEAMLKCESDEMTPDRRYRLGTPEDKWTGKKKKKKSPATIDLRFTLSAPDASGSRLKISSDSMDFFSGDGATGISASMRLRGTVLHGIMEGVTTEEDLLPCISRARERGELDENQAREAKILLTGALDAVRDRCWFSPSVEVKVICERGIIDTDGSNRRPDRVIVFTDHVDIVDYKFGKEEKAYASQLRKYAGLYRDMGYANVNAYLFYIGEEIRVENIKA